MKRFIVFYWKHMIILILSFIFFFLIILSFVSLATSHNYFYRIFLGRNVTDLLGIVSLSISLTAFFSIIFSLQQTIDNRQNELKQITVDLFKELRGEHFRNVRSVCWRIKLNWDENNTNEYRSRLIGAMFYETNDNIINKEEMVALNDLISFYTILSLYRGNENDIRHLNCFYYGWWRKFLYELAEHRDRQRIDALFDYNNFLTEKGLSKISIKFDHKTYISNITLKPVLKRLDNLCGFENLPNTFDIHKNGG